MLGRQWPKVEQMLREARVDLSPLGFGVDDSWRKPVEVTCGPRSRRSPRQYPGAGAVMLSPLIHARPSP